MQVFSSFINTMTLVKAVPRILKVGQHQKPRLQISISTVESFVCNSEIGLNLQWFQAVYITYLYRNLCE